MDDSGFAARSNKVTEEDAKDFLRAWNAGLPVHQGMSREPRLDTGSIFGSDFLDVYARAIA